MRTDNALNDYLDRKVIGEGPAINYDVDTVPLEQLPFAYRLSRFLLSHGAVIGGLSDGPFRAGAADSNGIVQLWTQLNCRENEPEKLGAIILERFGLALVFGGLVLPVGQECVTWSRAGNVGVRNVVSYLVGTDQVVQRWDVIVRKA